MGVVCVVWSGKLMGSFARGRIGKDARRRVAVVLSLR
jgi:hypothetical protein